MPASLKEPATFFTFDLLDLLEEMALFSKISVANFYQSIMAVNGRSIVKPLVS